MFAREIIVVFIKYNMCNKKQELGVLVKKRLSSVFLIVIMLFSPSLVFANYDLGPNVSGTASVTLIGNTTANDETWLEFILPTDGAIKHINICLSKVASPTDDLNIQIYNDDFGDPGSFVYTQTVINGTSLSTSNIYYHLERASGPFYLEAGRYWIRLSRSGAINATNYFETCGTTSTVELGYTVLLEDSSLVRTMVTSLVGFNFLVTATSTPVTGTLTVNDATIDNPVLSLALGVLLFVIGFYGVIWFFKKRS